MRQSGGYTLVELVMVLVIVGIMGAVVAPRFFDSSAFQSRGFADQVQATLRFAQKTAIAQRRNVCVAFTLPAPSTLTLTIANTSGAASLCDTALTSPDGQIPYTVTAPSGVTLSGGTAFNFDALGRPSAAQDITVSGYATHIIVGTETGYVHQ
jgi:MSHA pilin protein MshC